MLYTHFIGRIGKDAQVINGKSGDFLSMDVAVSDFRKGQETTLWVRVRSNRHVKLQKWLTRGRLILVEGVLSAPSIWQDKEGNNHVQLSAMADNIHFINVGKKKEGNNAPSASADVKETTLRNAPKEDALQGAPADKADDLPF